MIMLRIMSLIYYCIVPYVFSWGLPTSRMFTIQRWPSNVREKRPKTNASTKPRPTASRRHTSDAGKCRRRFVCNARALVARAFRVVGPIARRGSHGRRCRRRPAFAVTDDSIRAGMALNARRNNRKSNKLEPGLPLMRLPVGAMHKLLRCADCAFRRMARRLAFDHGKCCMA